MKTIFVLCAAALIAGGAFVYQSMRMPNKYGDFSRAQPMAVADLIARPQAYLERTVAVEGVVREQCTSMGCFFFLREGERTLRVDLQDIAMNAPRRNGHRVQVEGRMAKYGDGYQLWASAVEFK